MAHPSKKFWLRHCLIEIHIGMEEGVGPTEAQQRQNEEMKLKYLNLKNFLYQSIDMGVLDSMTPPNRFGTSRSIIIMFDQGKKDLNCKTYFPSLKQSI